SGHAGNAEPLASAAATLRAEGRVVLAWFPRLKGADAHAGRTETSLMLAVDPASVLLSAAEPGVTEPLSTLLPTLRNKGVAAVSKTGVLGDPSGATAEEGMALLD